MGRVRNSLSEAGRRESPVLLRRTTVGQRHPAARWHRAMLERRLRRWRSAAQDLTLKFARPNHIRCNRTSRACELMFVGRLQREPKTSLATVTACRQKMTSVEVPMEPSRKGTIDEKILHRLGLCGG